ncbi:MAG: CHAT domain-containing protein [Methylococcales bacterium]|nr:CHAT domain-containing protein [Methylococcales bacterium]
MIEIKPMSKQKTILIVVANPSNEARLRLDIETRDINEGLRLAKYRDVFVLKQIAATRVRDLSRSIQEYEPEIVHFCGHGAGEQGIVLEDNNGETQLVNTEALVNFFELFIDEVECVVLNACFSEVQAKEIVKHIPYVIGMNKAIGDKAAIEFSVGFYGALASDKSNNYEKAFKFGCSAIELMGISRSLIPQLFIKQGNSIFEKKEVYLKENVFINSKLITLRRKKLEVLEIALAIETDASVKFKLEYDISELKQQINEE